MWEETKKRFHIQEDSERKRRKNFLSAVASRFRHHKSTLISRFIERKTAPAEGCPNTDLQPWELYEGYITEQQWKLFEERAKSDAFKEKSEKGKQSAKHNVHRHTMGQKSYSRKRKEWIGEKLLPVSTEGNNGESGVVDDLVVNRPIEWCLGHTKPTKDGKREADPKKPETVRVVNHVMENLEKEAKEKQEGKTTTSERGVDALTRALGKKDHRGYVKCLGRSGVGVIHETAFGKGDRRGRRSTTNGCSNEEIEAVKATLTEEFEKTFEARLKECVAKELQAYIASISSLNNTPNKALQPQFSNQEPLIDMQVLTKCRLAVNDEFDAENLVVVAEGTIHPLNTGVMHNSQSLLRGHYRVSVDKVYPDHAMIDLPVPSPDGATKLGDAEKYFVQWPISLVLIDDKVKTTREEKDCQGSCGPNSVGSRCGGFEEPVGSDVIDTLTEECELLFYRMCYGRHDTTCISFKASFFYFEEDKEVRITSNDVSKFLRGACANVLLLHVYILYLIQDFISLFKKSQIAFLCPQRISAVEIERDVVKVQNYVKRAFISEGENKGVPCKFILAPYNEDDHWVLIVVDLRAGIAFEFDSCTRGAKENARPLACAPVMN